MYARFPMGFIGWPNLSMWGLVFVVLPHLRAAFVHSWKHCPLISDAPSYHDNPLHQKIPSAEKIAPLCVRGISSSLRSWIFTRRGSECPLVSAFPNLALENAFCRTFSWSDDLGVFRKRERMLKCVFKGQAHCTKKQRGPCADGVTPCPQINLTSYVSNVLLT